MTELTLPALCHLCDNTFVTLIYAEYAVALQQYTLKLHCLECNNDLYMSFDYRDQQLKIVGKSRTLAIDCPVCGVPHGELLCNSVMHDNAQMLTGLVVLCTNHHKWGVFCVSNEYHTAIMTRALAPYHT